MVEVHSLISVSNSDVISASARVGEVHYVVTGPGHCNNTLCILPTSLMKQYDIVTRFRSDNTVSVATVYTFPHP